MAFSGIPLPRVVADVGPGGPLVTALNALNDYEINRSAARYAPYTNYANAASKLAYSNFVGPQAIASILTNPATRGMFTKDQYNALANAFSSQVSGNGNALSNLPTPQHGLGGVGEKLLSKLMSFFDKLGPTSTSYQPQNALMQKSSMLLPQNNPDAGMRYDNQGNNITASPEEIENIANNRNFSYQNPSSQINRTAQGVNLPGTMGGYNPQAVTTAQEKALNTGATTEAKVNRNTWDEMHREAANQAINAQTTNDLANKFLDSYNDLSVLERGPGLGHVKGISTAAQDTDNASNALADAVARAQQQGHITIKDRETYRGIKPNRGNTPQSAQHGAEFIKGMNERIQEHQAFNVEADKMGYTPQEANAIWVNYIKKNPFYDSKHHKLLENNFDKWPRYLERNNAREVFNPDMKNARNESKVEGQVPPQGTIWMLTPEGDKVPVHKSRIEEAKKRKLIEIE